MPGNALHVNLSVGDDEKLNAAAAGMMRRAVESTAFFNPTANSYKRLGLMKAPAFVTWSTQNRSQLIRIPATGGGCRRAELRSPDPTANPYLVLTLIIYAALEGIADGAALPVPADADLCGTEAKEAAFFERLPRSLGQARSICGCSEFIKEHLPAEVIALYVKG